MTKYLLLVLALLFFGCKNSDFDDASKRNEDWAYWIDDKTGEGSWIRVSDKTTVEDGVYYMFYYNGKIYEKGKLKDKKNIDTMYRYDLNEELIRYIVFSRDSTFHRFIKNGAYKEDFPDGSLYQKGTVSDNAFKDDWVRYYKNGRIEGIQDFVNTTGKISKYYENGNPLEITSWKDNLQDGLSTFFYENGQVESKSYWVTGVREGKEEVWYDTGVKKSICYLSHNQLQGPSTEWTKKGEVELEGVYNDGLFTGAVFIYHENGTVAVASQGVIKEDKFDGVLKKFDENGKLIDSFYFENGVRIE